MADIGNNLSLQVKNQSSNSTRGDVLNLLHFQIVFFLITIVATIAGNALVLVAIALEARLRAVTNYFVACLAVSDILVACFSVSIRLITLFVLQDHGRLDQGILNLHVCRFWNWIDIFCEAASIYTLTVISIDRYFKISRPFQYREKVTKKVCIAIILSVLVLATVLASLGLVPFGDSGGVMLISTSCVNNNKIFYTMAAVVAFFVPLVVLMIMYTLIFRIALYHFKKDRAMTMVDPVSGKQFRYSAYKDLKATRTLFIVVSTFVVCWGPFFVLFQIVQYQPQTLEKLGYKTITVLHIVFFNILPYANSFFNPIIYACFDKVYRQSFRKILLKMVGHSEYLGKPRGSRNKKRNASVYELTTAQRRESSTVSSSSRAAADTPSDEQPCFYYPDTGKVYEIKRASSPSEIFTVIPNKESEVTLVNNKDKE